MVTKNEAELIADSTPRRGFRNMLDKENGGWWKTNHWWSQLLIWVGIINGMIAMVLIQTAAEPNAGAVTGVPVYTLLYTLFSGMAPVIGMVIIAQDALVEEKQTGTAAWVLSKPVSRVAFYASKLIANGLGGLVTMVIVPGLVAWLEIYLGTKRLLPPLAMLEVMGLIFLNLFFYLSLTLMLGALFQKRGGVIAIPMAVAFGGQLLGSVKPLLYVMPWIILWPMALKSDDQISIAAAILTGQPIPSVWPIITTVAFSVIFIIVGIWRFNKQEF